MFRRPAHTIVAVLRTALPALAVLAVAGAVLFPPVTPREISETAAEQGLQPETETTTAARPAAAAPDPTTGTTGARPAFSGSVTPIDPETEARMSSSWRPGCPVPLSDLRRVTLTHWGFDGGTHHGELVVHRDYAEGVLGVFAALFDAAFPIEQVRLVDEFGADDDRSMAANNTSGFNCRRVSGTKRWSEHAYGRAIDVNPVQNPYIKRNGEVQPPEGRSYMQRDPDVPGLITEADPVVRAFAGIGWRWGGRWRSPDYQHFSATGR